MRAVVFRKVPDPNTSSAITADDLALVGVNDHIVYRAAMGIASLNGPTSRLPDLHSTILGARNHPFPLAVERNPSYISGMSLEG
jgi:hypothetical protein